MYAKRLFTAIVCGPIAALFVLSSPAAHAAETPGPRFDVTSYGAVADDGLSDDTAFQDAIDDLNTAGHGVLVIPSGTFELSYWPTISINGFQIRGTSGARQESNSATVLLYTGSGDFMTFTDRRGFEIQNLHITAEGSSADNGIVLESVQDAYFRSVAVRNFTVTGWTLTSGTYSSIYNTFVNCSAVAINDGALGGIGLLLDEDTTTGKATNNNTFINFNGSSSDIGVELHVSPSENVFVGLDVDCGSTTAGSRTGTGMVIEGRNAVVMGANIEQCGTGIDIPTGSSDATLVGLGLHLSGNDTHIDNPDDRPIQILGSSRGNIEAAISDAGSSSADITPDTRTFDYYRQTLTGNIQIKNSGFALKGQRLTLELTQDGTGGRTVSFHSIFKVNWSPDTGAGKTNVISFYFNGTNWIQTSVSTGL